MLPRLCFFSRCPAKTFRLFPSPECTQKGLVRHDHQDVTCHQSFCSRMGQVHVAILLVRSPARSLPSRSHTIFNCTRKTKSSSGALSAAPLPACQSGMKRNPRFRRDYRYLDCRTRSPCGPAVSIFPCLCEIHLGKIGAQDQWPFLRILKRNRLTRSTTFKQPPVRKKNRRGINDIRFLHTRLTRKRKKIKNSLDSVLRQIAVA